MRALGVFAAVAIIVAGGAGSYFAVRALDLGGGAVAQPPGDEPIGSGSLSPEDIRQLIEIDAGKPRVSLDVVNGIEIGTDASPDNGYCDPVDSPPEYVEIGEARGTDLEIDPSDLPDGATVVFGEAVACGGEIVATYKDYTLRGGGSLSIGSRRFSPEAQRSWALYGAAERISEATVGGRAAVVESAIVSGFDDTTMVVTTSFGLIMVRGTLPVGELEKIALSVIE